MQEFSTPRDVQHVLESAAMRERTQALFEKTKRELAAANDAVEHWNAVNAELRTISEAIQHTVYGRIETTVTHALRFVFPDEDYSCVLTTSQKRGRVEAQIEVMNNGIRMDPMTQCGGGVVDVVSFALRLVCITSNPDKSRRVLVLDEPFKYVSAEYRHRASALLNDLSNELGFQLIIVTHDDDFKLGKEIAL